MRLIVSILLSPWSQAETSIHQTPSVFCREATSDQARLNRLNLTAYKILDNPLWKYLLLNQSIPYQYLVFIVISFSVLARQWICLWSYHHFYISIDVFEARWIKGSILPHLNFAVLATCYYDLILTWCSSVDTKEKTKQNCWTSSPRRRVILSEWYQCDNFSRVNEGPNAQSTLYKPGGVMNAASPLGNIKLMLMNGKQSLLVRSHV